MGIGLFVMQISQGGLSQFGSGDITVYLAVFSHLSAIPKQVFLGDLAGIPLFGL